MSLLKGVLARRASVACEEMATRVAQALSLLSEMQSSLLKEIQDGADLVERDPQLAQGNFLQALDDVHPDLGPTWIDKLPIRFASTPCEDYRRVRAIGEDNAEVLSDWLSMAPEQVAEKEQQGTLQ